MLIMEGVSIHYKLKKEAIPVIENLSLTISSGEALVILGPSGCGKSTLINTLAGTLSRAEGRIDFLRDGQRGELSPKVHRIGIIPQNCGLLPWKTVEENCLLPLVLRKELGSRGSQKDECSHDRKAEMDKIYRELNIEGLLSRYPKELSGGQVQRAAIARAFISKPDLLLMDEPFSSLDAITREEARALFLNIWKESRPTTILVTHSMEEALFLGERILVMGAEGSMIYEMQNPYFGIANPETLTYLETKRALREQLRVERRGTVDEQKMESL